MIFVPTVYPLCICGSPLPQLVLCFYNKFKRIENVRVVLFYLPKQRLCAGLTITSCLNLFVSGCLMFCSGCISLTKVLLFSDECGLAADVGTGVPTSAKEVRG